MAGGGGGGGRRGLLGEVARARKSRAGGHFWAPLAVPRLSGGHSQSALRGPRVPDPWAWFIFGHAWTVETSSVCRESLERFAFTGDYTRERGPGRSIDAIRHRYRHAQIRADL